ncbi:MAG: hypothetical protein NTX30_12020 [Deltaproteobacteria bacterium]|jgi:hypothetical protein|nr:hypothetical protein [Deltaproteobacteria bacterium]
MAKSGPISDASRMDKTAKGLSGNDLCALCFLFGHLLVSIIGAYRGRKIFFPRNEKITINRRDPGGRREDAIFIK